MNKLYRSATDRKIAGICGGLGEYFNIDPTLVRLILVAITILGFGIGLVFYIISMFIIPERPIR